LPKKITRTKETPPPRLNDNLATVFQVRNDVAAVLEFEYEHKTLAALQFDQLVAYAMQELPAGVNPQAVAQSLPELLGCRLTEAKLRAAAWRLAGNLPLLRRGIAVPPWKRQTQLEWVPAQFETAQRGRRSSWDFTLRALAGTPAGLQMPVRWTERACAYTARFLGFTQFRSATAKHNPHPLRSPQEFVTLRVLALLDPLLCDEGPGFHEVAFPGAIKDWNREQQRYRARVGEAYACPFEKPRTLPCVQCSVGYLQCRAAVHAATYESRPCPACGQESAPFDPAGPGAVCVNCERNVT